MSKRKRVNPHRKPATKADIEKAKREAENNAVDYAFAIMFSALRDKEGWGKVRLARLWREVNYLSDSVTRGYVSINDLMTALEEEAGITLT